MVENKHRRNVAALLIPFLLSACASSETIKIGQTGTENSHSRGVLWPFVAYKKDFFERLNTTHVLSVDGIRITADGFAITPLIELSEGAHEVTIQHKRESYLCGYLGCIDFEQAVVSVALNVEAGHSYLPLARNLCGNNWVWVIDKGKTAEDDLQKWRKGGIPQDYNMSLKDLTGFKVVSGKAPPDKCDSQ